MLLSWKYSIKVLYAIFTTFFPSYSPSLPSMTNNFIYMHHIKPCFPVYFPIFGCGRLFPFNLIHKYFQPGIFLNIRLKYPISLMNFNDRSKQMISGPKVKTDTIKAYWYATILYNHAVNGDTIQFLVIRFIVENV